MHRRTLFKAGLLGGLDLLAGPFVSPSRCRLAAAPSIEISTKAIDLVAETMVIDMLGLLTLNWLDLFRWQRDPGSFTEADFRHLESTGIDIYYPAVAPREQDPREAAMLWIDGWKRLLAARPCYLQRIDSVPDLVSATALGRIGVIVGFQDSRHFLSVQDVDLFHRLGQRISQLTYNGRNPLGSGCWTPRDRGLTQFGAEIVAAMNRTGMAVDVSHCGEQTTLDAIAASTHPVLVTHSNCRALVPAQPRCKSDRVIRALADAGGVMGITAVRSFVRGDAPATLNDLLDHFDHAIRLVGVEHVGIGSDVDVSAIDASTGRIMPSYDIRGLHPAARAFQIADGLLARGYGARDVQLVLGENFLRTLSMIWNLEPSPDPDHVPPRRRDPFCPAPAPVSPPPTRDR